MNFILFAIDACRGDHLHCNGYGRETSPNIDRLASEGITFTDVTPGFPYTAPSFTTIFTGLYAFNHKMIANPHAVRNANDFLLDENIWTLAQVCLDAGYRTATFDSLLSFWSHSKQFVRGYQYLFNPTGDSKGVQKSRLPAEAYTPEILHWLERHHEEKFFMFIHFWDTHQPFTPPDEFKKFSGTDGLKLKKAADGVEIYERVGPKERAEMPENLENINCYDGEILHADYNIGLIVERLKELGIYDETAILVTADHGELMVEGPVEHIKFCMTGTWHPTMNVPFVLRVPRVKPARSVSDALVHHVDIVPTVMEVLGLEFPAELDGFSVMPILRGEKDSIRDAVLGEGTYCHVPQRFVKTRDYKFMINLRPEPYKEYFKRLEGGSYKLKWADPPKRELTHRRSDPEERLNLCDKQPEKAEEMRQLLQQELNAKLRGLDPFRPGMIDRIWTGGSLWN